MQCKVQDMEKNNESLQVMFDEMLKRNTTFKREGTAEGYTPRNAVQTPRHGRNTSRDAIQAPSH